MDLDYNIITGWITIFIIIVGVTGNLLTIIALLQCPRIRNVTASFIISLCVADGLFCAIVLPFNALRFFGNPWTQNDYLCKLVPFLQYGNVGLSLLFITMITINRYVMIAHYNIYSAVYRPLNVAAMILLCLMLSFGMQLPTLLGIWGEYKYNDILKTCSISKDRWGNSSKTTLFIIGFVVPCIIIIVCYARIFWVVRSSESKLRQHSGSSRPPTNCNGKADLHETKRKGNEWKITKMVLVIFLSFLICYLPITIVKVFDTNTQLIWLHFISYIMLYMSACINPIIYVIMNNQYRKAYGKVLKFRVPRIFTNASAKPIEEQPSRTLISQVSVTLIPMNVMDEPKN